MDQEHIPAHLDQMPPVRSQDDLDRHWRALMGKLGFAHRPEPTTLTNLMDLLGRLLGDEPSGTVAFLLARPGLDPITPADRDWAAALTRAAAVAGVPIEPVHLATDHAVRVFAPDDLASRHSA